MTLLVRQDKNVSSCFMDSEVTVSVFEFLSQDKLDLENKLETKLFIYC